MGQNSTDQGRRFGLSFGGGIPLFPHQPLRVVSQSNDGVSCTVALAVGICNMKLILLSMLTVCQELV